MSKLILKLSIAVLGVSLIAATAQTQGTSKPKRGDQSRLTRVDLDEAGGSVATAYDAVRLLRPRWLSPPLGKQAGSNMTGGGGGATSVIVYVDDIRQPDVERSLGRITNAELVELRYLDQNRAVQEYGPGHEAGAVQVTTVRKKK